MTNPISRPAWLRESEWPFTTNTIALHGNRVAYADVGEGPALFFLNVPQWSIVWRDVILLLRGEHRCITLDAPGLGQSDRIPAADQHLGTVRDAVVALVDTLELTGATLVCHDLGGLSGLAAASLRTDAFQRLSAVNTFGWRPSGVLLPSMLRLFGSAPIRVVDTATRLLPIATSGPLGVGRRMNKATRAAFRRGFDRPATAAMHRYFADAARNHVIHEQAGIGLSLLAGAQNQTIFGAWGDYMRFARHWTSQLPHLTQTKVPGSLHFPMNDAPELVAETLRLNETLSGSDTPHGAV